MTIYIEYAIIDNLVINCLLLWFTFRTIKQRTPKRLVLLSASVGTIFALVMPIINIGGAWGAAAMVLIKIFVGAFMVFIVQHKNFARFLLFFLLFVTYTFALGGAIYGITFAATGTAGSLLYFTQTSTVPVGVFIGAAAAFMWVMSKLIKFLNVRHSINSYLRDAVITYDGNKFKITTYLDTGNRLVDPVSRAPVVIITLSLFLKMFPDVTVDCIFMNKLCKENIADGHYINFSTVDKKDAKMFVFAPGKLEIVDRKETKTVPLVRLGVSMRAFKDAVKYDALLNAHLA